MNTKRFGTLCIVLCGGAGTPAGAGEATTSAAAGTTALGPGTATATATYDGAGTGIANTRSRSGVVNLARGLAIGLDRDGLSFSTSYALAPTIGPAVAGTLNVAVGFDGRMSSSVGRTVAQGDPRRTVYAGGRAGGRRAAAVSSARTGGHTGPRGAVRSSTTSRERRFPRGRWERPRHPRPWRRFPR